MGVVFFPSLPFMGVMLFPSFRLGNVFREWGLVRSSPPTPHSPFFCSHLFLLFPLFFFIISFSFVFLFSSFSSSAPAILLFFFFFFFFQINSFLFQSISHFIFLCLPRFHQPFCLLLEGVACVRYTERVACNVCIKGIASYNVTEDTTDCNLL